MRYLDQYIKTNTAMTKPFSLQPLMDLVQHQNDTATHKLGQLNKQEHSAQSKLEMLQQYRKDYQTRLQDATRNGIDQVQLRNFHEFINKLDAAINQQLKLVGQSRASTQVGRSEFDTARRKLKSFDTLQQRHIKTQKKVVEKFEQAAHDEHTGRNMAYKAINAEDQNK
jgi:flagellar FliJ protein